MTTEAERQLSEDVARKLGWEKCDCGKQKPFPCEGWKRNGTHFVTIHPVFSAAPTDWPSFRSPEIVCAMIEWLIGRGKCFGFIPRDERCECEIESDPRSPYSDGDVSCSGNTWQEALARAFLAAQE